MARAVEAAIDTIAAAERGAQLGRPLHGSHGLGHENRAMLPRGASATSF